MWLFEWRSLMLFLSRESSKENIFFFLNIILYSTDQVCTPCIPSHCCKYLRCTAKYWLIWRKYAWLTWRAITSFGSTHASKTSVFSLTLHVFLLSMCLLIWIKLFSTSMWKTLKTQHQQYAGQTPCCGIWILSVLSGKSGEHGQFPSLHPASFNTVVSFLSWMLFFRPWLVLLSAVLHFQGLCNINNINPCAKAL